MKAILIGALAATVTLAACTKEEAGLGTGALIGGIIGNKFGNGTGKVLTTAAGIVVGGIIGSEIGRRLDERDRLIAQQAEFAALEKGQTGVATPWRSAHTRYYGQIVPGKPYRIRELDCRDYVHTVYIDGRPEILRGTACRNPDGTWSQVG